MAMPCTTPERKRPAVPKGRGEAGILAPRIASFWKHLSNPVRLQILLALADGKKSLRQIGERSGQSQEEFSYHLALLCAAQVVVSHWEGYEASY